MATTAIWDVRGRMDQIVNYASNPDKTKNQKEFEYLTMDWIQKNSCSFYCEREPASSKSVRVSRIMQKAA